MRTADKHTSYLKANKTSLKEVREMRIIATLSIQKQLKSGG